MKTNAPNPACASRRTGLSTCPAGRVGRMRVVAVHGVGMCSPRQRYRVTGTLLGLNGMTPSTITPSGV